MDDDRWWEHRWRRTDPADWWEGIRPADGSMPEPTPIRPVTSTVVSSPEPAPPVTASTVDPVRAAMPGRPPDPNKPHWYMGEWHAPGSRYGPVPTDDVGERLLVRFIAHLAGFGRKP